MNRRRALAVLALPLLGGVGTLSGCVGRGWSSFDTTTVTVATGNRGGVFVRYGRALALVLERMLDGVQAETRSTNASLENLSLVADGVCDIGFSLGDAAADAVTGSDAAAATSLYALTRMYDSFVHLVVHADSSYAQVADLAGARIGVGAPGSGTQVIATRVLGVRGIGARNARLDQSPLEDASEAFGEGRLDAFFFVSGLPNQAIATLADETPIRLLDLGGVVEPMVAAYGPQYVRAPIPPSAYGLDEAVSTLSVKNYLIASPSLPDDLAYAITRLVFEAQDEIDDLEPGVAQPTLGAAIFTDPLRLHPGALRYYRERGT